MGGILSCLTNPYKPALLPAPPIYFFYYNKKKDTIKRRGKGPGGP